VALVIAVIEMLRQEHFDHGASATLEHVRERREPRERSSRAHDAHSLSFAEAQTSSGNVARRACVEASARPNNNPGESLQTRSSNDEQC
jgi:hypothetical protein